MEGSRPVTRPTRFASHFTNKQATFAHGTTGWHHERTGINAPENTLWRVATWFRRVVPVGLLLALAIGPLSGFIVTWLRVYAAYGWNAAWIQIQQWPG